MYVKQQEVKSRNSRSFPKSKQFAVECAKNLFANLQELFVLKKMQLDETAKFWKVL